MTLKELREHKFPRLIFEKFKYIKKTRKESDPKIKHEFNEYQKYIVHVGSRYTKLISLCEQLNEGVHFISIYKQTPVLTRLGIDRTSHIKYNLESYLVRTQTIFDCVLKLIDAVFYLQNSEFQCKYSVVIQNKKVQASKVPEKVKLLFKTIDEFRAVRNSVVHGEGYFEISLLELELNSIKKIIHGKVDKKIEIPSDLVYELNQARIMTQKFLKKKKEEFLKFNTKVYLDIYEIFNVLINQFIKEDQVLYRLIPEEVKTREN